MLQLQKWQWIILALPIALIVIFLLVAAGIQIHAWHLSWIWAIFTLMFVGWRWLLVKWTNPAIAQFEAIAAEVSQELQASKTSNYQTGDRQTQTVQQTVQAEQILESILAEAKTDAPIWEDWQIFWQRCLTLLKGIAELYHPEVKYPVLNIYIPQAYSLMRGTVDDLDQWMQKLSPALRQVSLAQAYQAYEVYQKLEPSARKVLQAWSWAQWLLNPVTAIARRASQRYTNQANQQLLVNLGSLMREAALRNLCRQAIALYGGTDLPSDFATPFATTVSTKSDSLPVAVATNSRTLQELLKQATPPETLAQSPLKLLLVGRTGAGKSSLINTLFQSKLAAVDVLPSTDQIQSYRWQIAQADVNETLELLDTPGYEQVNRPEFRQRVLDYAAEADLLLLATPALDPALQMDVDFLTELRTIAPTLPAIAIVTQVDRLRPLKEWNPPYDWQWGDRPKEVAIREATAYRLESLGNYCDRVFPIVSENIVSESIVNEDLGVNRPGWGIDALSVGLIEAIAPTQQIRLARFLSNLEARAIAAAKIIDRYSLQMTTSQGMTLLVKSPVLQFLSTLSTGSPALAYVLADRIPVEQLPVVISKLQMAYELHGLLKPEPSLKSGSSLKFGQSTTFDLVPLWSLFLDQSAPADRSAWALGQALVEYWTKGLTVEQVRDRMMEYL
jgi:uncharacterized protein